MAQFRDPAAAEAGGIVLVPAGLVVAVALLLHPLPTGGFEESPSQLAGTPIWGAIHVAIAAGFVLATLGGLLVVVSGGPADDWLTRLAWGGFTLGLFWFTGVALLNAWVMHSLADAVAANPATASVDARLYDAFNRLLVGFGWLGNPLFLAGLTGIAALEVRGRSMDLPRWLAWLGLALALLSWLRGIGGALGLPALNVFLLANVPAFAWVSFCGWRIASRARESRQASGSGTSGRPTAGSEASYGSSTGKKSPV